LRHLKLTSLGDRPFEPIAVKASRLRRASSSVGQLWGHCCAIDPLSLLLLLLLLQCLLGVAASSKTGSDIRNSPAQVTGLWSRSLLLKSTAAWPRSSMPCTCLKRTHLTSSGDRPFEAIAVKASRMRLVSFIEMAAVKTESNCG
jgi:hypothetical protein